MHQNNPNVSFYAQMANIIAESISLMGAKIAADLTQKSASKLNLNEKKKQNSQILPLFANDENSAIRIQNTYDDDDDDDDDGEVEASGEKEEVDFINDLQLKNQVKSSSGAKTTSDLNKPNNKKRTTLREEITISSQFQLKVPQYYERKSVDLMRIVEDQVRKVCFFKLIFF